MRKRGDGRTKRRQRKGEKKDEAYVRLEKKKEGADCENEREEKVKRKGKTRGGGKVYRDGEQE